MMDFLFSNVVRGRGAIGLLIVRLIFGMGMVLHGSQKTGTPFT